MDVYCVTCGEPWDLDSLHEEAGERYGIPYYANEAAARAYNRNPEYDSDAYQAVFRQVQADFRTSGCHALATAFGMQRCSLANASTQTDRTFGLTRQEASGALYELLGDDMDGAAAMLEDMGF